MIETDELYTGLPFCRVTFFAHQGEAFSSLPGKKRKKLIKGQYPNVPSSLPLVLEGLVRALNDGKKSRGELILSIEEVAAATTNNAIEFFGFNRSSVYPNNLNAKT